MGDTEENTTVVINSKNIQNGTKKRLSFATDEDNFTPPDGGSRAWLIMLGSFFCNGILFGVINSYGVVFNEIQGNLIKQNDTEASSKAALVGSLSMGTTFIVSPIAGVLTDSIGLRRTTLLGGLLASGGMLLSSFCAYQVEALYFTYGILYGLGGALAYTPSLAVLGHYFKKYLGVVNGVVTAGSSVFTVIMPYVIDWLLREIQFVWTLRALALFATGIMGCALLYKPAVKKTNKKVTSLSHVFNVSIWKNHKYIVWAVVIPLSLFGYFVPYVFMTNFVKDNFPSDYDSKLPIICVGITSGLGRLIFGYIADFPRVNRILLQQVSFFVIGVLTMLLPSATGSFTLLICIALGMGLFDGCFVSLLGPIAFDLCGQAGATQAIGFLLGLCSLPLTIGPYVAGVMYDHTHSYNLPFLLAGIPPIVGSVAMFLVMLVKDPQTAAKDPSEQPLQDEEKLEVKVSGRLIAKTALSEGVWCDDNKNYCDQRRYSYSIL